MSDILLDGHPYAIEPGSYQRSSDAFEGVAAGIWRQDDFVGGQLRAIQMERDREWGGIGVGPANLGQGVEPWPYTTSFADGGIATATTLRIPSIIVGDNCYMAIGRFLYKSVSLSAGAWAAWTQVYDATAGKTITHLAQLGGKVICCVNGGVAMNAHTPGSPGSNAPFMASEQGWRAVGYGGSLIWADATDQTKLKIQLTASTFETRTLDSPIQIMTLHAGRVAIATKTSIYLLGGRVRTVAAVTEWSEELSPLFTNGVWTDDEDYQFLLSFGGKLYTWLGNELMEFNPTGDRAGWRSVGLSGRSCNGATVAGPYLVIALVNRLGESQLWAFDGSGFWLIHTHASQARVWPVYTAGAGNIDVVCFRDGSGTGMQDLFRLVYRHSSASNLRTGDAEFVTAMIHAGHPNVMKGWRRIGANFATPEPRHNLASVSPITLQLEYSINGGRNWTSAGSILVTDPTQREASIAFDIGAQEPVSFYIQLRVKWSGVVDWSPTLSAVWAEWELIDRAAKRRRWSMTIRATDRARQRDGSADPRAGYELASDLWTAWSSALPIDFQDVDFHATGITHKVQVVQIREDMKATATNPEMYESVVKLQLVQL